MLLCSVLALAGCGDEEERPAAACPASPEPVVAALRDAPGQVRIGGVKLSSCLTEGSRSEDLQRVGTAYVEAAAALAREAGRHPEGRRALELGYLVGAARRGAGSASAIQAELVHRLERSAALDGASDEAQKALADGMRAGEERG